MRLLPAEALFWGSVGIVAYVYLGYPLLVALLATLRARRVRRPPAASPVRTVSLIVPAHNEEAVIGAKILNAHALEYPAGQLQLIVVSDGSSDRTGEVARRVGNGRILLLEQPTRQGKAAALNAAVSAATGEILVFTDANVIFERDAIQALVRRFDDPEVGCAVGRVLLTSPQSGEHPGEGLYMRYERWLHAMESRTGTMIGIDGALFAVRRRLYPHLPPGAVVEDFVAGLRCVDQGYRISFEPRAIGYEEAAASVADEFRRKVRMVAGGFQALVEFRHLLNPLRYPLVAWQLLSHKLLRWLVPFPLAVALGANLVLASHPFYMAALLLQGIFYVGAGAAWQVPRSGDSCPSTFPTTSVPST